MDIIGIQQVKNWVTRFFIRTIPPSGDVTGVTDTANFNAAMAKHAFAKGVPGSTYYFNGPVYCVSGSEWDMTACIVNQVTGTLANVLRNRAVDSTRTTNDGRGLSGSANVSSLSANFTSADIGSAIGVVGGAAGGATWYGVLASPVSATTAPAWTGSNAYGLAAFVRPTSANGRLYWASVAGTSSSSQPTWPTTTGGTVTDGTVTWYCLGAATGATVQARRLNGANVSNTCDTTVSGGALSIFANRDTDITVHGGTWNFCDQSAGSTPLDQQPCCFRRLDGLHMYDMRVTQGGTPGLGGRICLSGADVTNVQVRDITFNGTAAGLQIDAPCFYVVIENIQGVAGDDMVALSTEDFTAFDGTNYLRDTQGNVGAFDVRNIVGGVQNGVICWNTFKLYGLGSGANPKKFSFTQGRISGIKGSVSSSGNGVNLISSLAVFYNDVNIRDVSVIANGTHPIVSMTGTTHYNDFFVDNISWDSGAAATSGIVYMEDPRGSVKITNLKMKSQAVGNNIGVLVKASGAALSGATWGTAITLDGVYCGPNEAPQCPTFTAFQFISSPAGGTLPYLLLNNVVVSPTTSGCLVNLVNALAIPDLNISNVKGTNLTSLISAPSSTSAITARLTNVSAAGTNLAAVGCPLTLKMANVAANTSGALVALAGANATPLRIRGVNFIQSGAGALVSRDGSQAISVDGNLRVDVALLTPQDQDIANNTNSASGPLGLVIYSATTASWQGLAAIASQGTYTPTLTSTGTQPTIGTSPTQQGFYTVTSDGWCKGFAKIVLGTGSAQGTGTYLIGLPVAIRSAWIVDGFPIGGAKAIHSSTNYAGESTMRSGQSQKATALLSNASSTWVSLAASNPVAWVDGDSFFISFNYPV